MGKNHTVTLVLALFLSTVAAQSQGAPEPDQERELIAVFPEHFPPIYYRNENGHASGFGIDVMNAVARRAGLKIRYIHKRSWTQVMKALETHEADLIPNLGITEGRTRRFDFSDPIESIPVTLFVRSDNHRIQNWDDVVRKKYTVGVVRENYGIRIINNARYGHFKVFNSVSEALTALHNRDVDSILYPRLIVEQLLQRLGMRDEIRATGPPVINIKRAIAVQKGNRILLDQLNLAIRDFIGSDEYRSIYHRWHPAPPFWTAPRVLQLTGALLIIGILLTVLLRMKLLKRVNQQLSTINALNSAILDTVLEGIVTIDTQGKLLSVNPAAGRIFRCNPREMIGNEIQEYLPHKPIHQLLHHLQTPRNNAHTHSDSFFDTTALRNNAEVFPVRIGIASTKIDLEQRLVCTIHDMTDQYQAERRLEFLTNHDPLTGLLNHRGIELLLENLMHLAQRDGNPITCMCIGINRFRQIQEAYGSQVSDEVLVQVSTLLRNTLRAADIIGFTSEQLIARSGDDIYVLILPNTDLKGAQVLASRLLEKLSLYKIDHDQGQLHIEGNIGIAGYPTHGQSAKELLSHAESAMHHAGESTVGNLHVFKPSDVEDRNRIEQTLERVRSALSDDRLLLHFQPIQHTASGTISHYEVLLRLADKSGDLIMPGEFIPIAENHGMITKIDYRVLQLAFSHLAGIQSTRPDLSIAINLSARHIDDNRLYEWLQQTFNEGVIDPGKIIIEITESAALQNLVRAKEFMEPLTHLGCRFSLDDFGVGFTSFAQLRTLPVDFVKIDGMFVRNLVDSSEDQAVVRAIVDIAHSLGKQVVAEFVENQHVASLLGQYKVDYLQGYWIGRPGPEFVSANDKNENQQSVKMSGHGRNKRA